MGDHPSQADLEQAVLAVLAGQPLDQAAAAVPTSPTDLNAAIHAYQSAGHAALEARAQSTGWHQVAIEFADPTAAEPVAVNHLRPALVAARTDGTITGWFFVRKSPYWRLRYQSEDNRFHERFTQVLDRLVRTGEIVGWAPGVYEPESMVFGGPDGMNRAHALFCHDSHHVLNYLARTTNGTPTTPELGRRELALLLYTTLFRGAGQDWYEQGDIWDKVTHHRPANTATTAPRHHDRLLAATRHLLSVDTSATSTLLNGGPLTALAGWIIGFEDEGHRLAELAQRGALHRGLRSVLTHHVIFGWNRLGLSTHEQSNLAALAKTIITSTDSRNVG